MPHAQVLTTLLAVLIGLILSLPQIGQYIFVSIGQPQLGQVFALFETSFPHSVHLIIAIIISPINLFFSFTNQIVHKI